MAVHKCSTAVVLSKIWVGFAPRFNSSATIWYSIEKVMTRVFNNCGWYPNIICSACKVKRSGTNTKTGDKSALTAAAFNTAALVNAKLVPFCTVTDILPQYTTPPPIPQKIVTTAPRLRYTGNR